MANSVVKVTDVKNEQTNDSLVLFIGEDGTVTPDQDTVETFLSEYCICDISTIAKCHVCCRAKKWPYKYTDNES